MRLIYSIKHDICIGRSAIVDLALSLAWSLRTWNTCCVQHSLWYLRCIAWASFGDIALLNLVINNGSLEISTACLTAFPEFVVLTVIQLAEKAQHFWQRSCCRSCEWLWCPWYICFHFWAWSFMAWPFHSILSCGHWMFKAVSGSLQFWICLH